MYQNCHQAVSPFFFMVYLVLVEMGKGKVRNISKMLEGKKSKSNLFV